MELGLVGTREEVREREELGGMEVGREVALPDEPERLRVVFLLLV